MYRKTDDNAMSAVDDANRPAGSGDIEPAFDRVFESLERLCQRIASLERVVRCRLKGETCDKYVGSWGEKKCDADEGLTCEDYSGDEWRAKK